jgi:Trk K+ transport system NAD-binding subunit
MDRPIVLCGLGRMGAKVLEYLKAAALPVVVIDNTCRPDDPRLLGYRLVLGDCSQREVLESAGVVKARGVLVLTANDLLNITTAVTIRTLNPEVRIVLRMFNQHLIGRLGKTLHNVFALSTSLLTAPILALTAVTGQALATFAIDNDAETRRQIIDIPITPTSPLCGRLIADIIGPRDAVVVAHRTSGGPGDDWRVLLDADPDYRLAAGDRLVICGEHRLMAALLEQAGQQSETPDLLWAGWFRRMFRVASRTLWEIDVPTRICAAILIFVVIVSTFVLRLNIPDYSVPHAFLRSISIVATAGRIHEEARQDLPGVEVFVSVLRILGAVLMAAFVAIVTNYLLRARLGGAFELRRIPDGGHHIVCGVGTVGFRVIEELIGYGERVVAIERNPDSRFIPTARRLGAAVIVGDAAVNEVLRQAHVATAHSVIAATNNDLTNLAVALQARELNPHQRVVLLLSDPKFAHMMKDAAQVQLAASVPALAAPAFVAGLFGDRVQTIFQIGERLFAVIDLVIQERDPLAEQSVRSVAVDYHCQPVAVVSQEAQTRRPQLHSRLHAGDRLVVLTALSDIEPLLARRPPSGAFAVEVTSCPLPTRGWLAGLLRTRTGFSQDEAEKAVEHLPLCLGRHLTRGQAEDLLAHLLRERVTAHLISGNPSP